MLKKLTVRNFKSLNDVTVELPRLSVLFGPNAVGKSNLLDAIQALSRIGNAPTLSDALEGLLPVGGHSFEAFSYAPDGLPGLFRKGSARFTLEADLTTGSENYRYRIEPRVDLRSGQLSINDEYLTQLSVSGKPRGTAAIEREGPLLHIRPQAETDYIREELVGLNHSILSDRSLGPKAYPYLEQVRNELLNWRTYYFEPRMKMREEQSPADVFDIGVHGEYIASFLYKLRAEYPKNFDAVFRTLRAMIPSIETLNVELDERRGMLELWVRQAGIEYSSRILSEGTLRVLALCAMAVNPWGGSLVALEEPENGVHPRQIDLIAQLLFSLTEQYQRQVVVTTHSPLFVDAILKVKREAESSDIGLFSVRLTAQGTVVKPFDVTGQLFRDQEIAEALANRPEDGMFESLILRGLIDE